VSVVGALNFPAVATTTIVMHWSIMPAVVMTRISSPATQEPPDWLKAVVLFVAALLVHIQFVSGAVRRGIGLAWLAITQILKKILQASIILGILWAAWHVPLCSISWYYCSIFRTANEAAFFTLATISLSVLMTFLFLHARGSLLLT
jgi:hypothetical protein